MSTSIEQYRAAIGHFYNISHNFGKSKMSCIHGLNCIQLLIFSLLLHNLQFVLLLYIYITICGDVELNPGPSSDGSTFIDDNLNDISAGSCSSIDSISSDIFNSRISLIHLNVRSLIPKLDLITCEFENLAIIALSETSSSR